VDWSTHTIYVVNDGSPTASAGTVIRFYKGPGNTGTHIGYLWTASGTLLGQVACAGESASGWQEADFSSPIAVTADTTYVASYFAPKRRSCLHRGRARQILLAWLRCWPWTATWPKPSPRRCATGSCTPRPGWYAADGAAA
jgi:hypothetical protein